MASIKGYKRIDCADCKAYVYVKPMATDDEKTALLKVAHDRYIAKIQGDKPQGVEWTEGSNPRPADPSQLPIT